MTSFPRSRVDALTDGIFAFAMTLLALELRLPDLPVKDGAALIAELADLWPKYIAYIISFFVLAALWRGTVDMRRVEAVSCEGLRWWMLYLFFVTSIPFSSSVVGLHGNLPPAVWLYAVNMIVVSGLSLRLRALEIAAEHRPAARAGDLRVALLIATALLSVALSVITPGYAMLAHLLNAPAGLVASWCQPTPATPS